MESFAKHNDETLLEELRSGNELAFNEVFRQGAVLNLTGLIIGLDALIVAMAVVLFPYLWKD